MSDDNSISSDDDHSSSKEMQPFEMLTEKEKAGKRTKKPKNKWTWYYDLSEKQRKAENERLRKEFADVEKEFEEIEKFQLVTEPFTHKIRGSSLSPNTPPLPPPRTTTIDESITASGMSASSKAFDTRRVMFRLQDGSIVSSDDDSYVPPKRRPLSGRRLKYDEEEGPPTRARDVDEVAWDSSGSEESSESTRPPLLPAKQSMLSIKQRGSDGQVAGPSTSLTKAEVIMKRRERIERQRSLEQDLRRSRQRSSSEASSTRQNVLARPASVVPHSYSFAERREQDAATGGSTDVRESISRSNLQPQGSLGASPVPVPRRVDDDVEDPLPPGMRPQSLRGEGTSPSSSTASVFPSFREGHKKGGPPGTLWHSTPLESTKVSTNVKKLSFRQRTFSWDASPGSEDRQSCPGLRIQGRGEEVRTKLFERDTGGSGAKLPSTTAVDDGASAGTSGSRHVSRSRDSDLITPTVSGAADSEPRSAVAFEQKETPPPHFPSPLSLRHCLSRSSMNIRRSTMIRFEMANNRERVLVSHTTSAPSAIASFLAECSPSAEPSAREAEDQDKKQHRFSEAGHVDVLSELLKLCGQTSPLTFEEALRLSDECLPTRKLGEGCSAEVYHIRRANADDSAVKVVPVGGEWRPGTEKPLTVAGAIPEVVMSRELSNLRSNPTNQSSNFIELRRVHCVQGPYHAELIRSWKKYDVRFCSENENPETFDAAQMYVLFEFEYGGKTLDRFKGSPEMFHSAFLQVSCSLAAAESELEFEHLDLHCDNVLMRRTSEKEVRFLLHGREVRLATAAVRATIIDYTLSRMRKGENVVFTDLAQDDELFRGLGSYQYDIYRLMKERNGNNWEPYQPVTNVVWLHYLLSKILIKCALRSKRDADESDSSARSELAGWAETIRDFPSVSAFVARNFLNQHSHPPGAPPGAPPGSRPCSPLPSPAGPPEKLRQREKRTRPLRDEAASHPMRLRARRT